MYNEANVACKSKLNIYASLQIKCYPNPPLHLGYSSEHADREHSFFQCSTTYALSFLWVALEFRNHKLGETQR